MTIRYSGKFEDKAVYDSVAKTAVSVRDGVLEYRGSEMGMEPADKLFKVFRSPATIANAAMRMAGIPITDEHVTLDVPAPTEGGKVTSADMIDVLDEATGATIAIKNKLAASDALCESIDAGKRELSLGYNADLVPHDVYDFEQLDIMPHHLAVVDQGRCGSMCSFLDKKMESEDKMDKEEFKKLLKAFTDTEGSPNMQQIVELATALPEAIKSVPVDQLKKLLPALKQIVEAAKTVAPEVVEEVATEGEGAVKTEDEKDEQEVKDTEAKEKDEKTFSDAVASEVSKKKAQFIDEAVKAHGAAITKARDFVAEDYVFTDKSTAQVMRDALATQSSESFTDSELPLAFKMLKQLPANYREFADKNEGSLSENIGDKEL